jgi:hypothetical protein
VKISNIRRYIEALGGRLEVRAVFSRKHKTVDIAS